MHSHSTPSNLLDPTLDLVFKLLLTRNPDLLHDMIVAVLDLQEPILELEILNPEIPEDAPGDKNIVLDVRARLDNGHVIDLEMQSTAPAGTRERFLYYWARNFVGSIGLLLFPKLGLASADRRAKLERWARFLRAKTIEELEALAREDVIMSVAKDALERLSADPDARRMASDREAAVLMHQHLVNASREEGRAEGREEGREEGRAEGREEGREEGRAEGREEGREEGRAASMARAIVDVLQRRGVAVSDEQAQRIAACRDDGTLMALWDRAWTVTSADELWG